MLRKVQYKYIVTTVFVLGLFMDLLDSTITNVAVPTLGKEFHASPTTIEWVVTAYLLSLAVFIPVSGWAGDRFGTKRTFCFALTVFVSASLLCGLAWNVQTLILFRVLQGIGGGMMTPVGTAMLYRVFPPAERARASSLLSIPAVLAPACGPVVGGYLVQYQSWRAIFFVNIPFGLTALVIAFVYLREERQEGTGRLDVPGFLLSAPALGAIVYALAEAGSRGFGDPQVVLFGGVGLALAAAFVAVELRVPKPMIDLRLFKNRLFASANAVSFIGFAGGQGVFFLLPIWLQAERGLSPISSGLATFPMAIGVVTMMPLAGKLYVNFGPRRMMMVGLFLMALASLGLCLIDLRSELWWVRLLMLLRGWGFGLTLIPQQTATFATIRPEDTGRASAIFSSVRQVAASFGVALLGTVLTNRLASRGAHLGDPLSHHNALLSFHDAFAVGALLSLIGIAASFLIDDKLAAGTMRPKASTVDPDLVPAAALAD